MSKTLKTMKCSLLAFAMLACLLPWTAAAQGGMMVRGLVSDVSGAPLPGATVQVKGTTTGVSTDQGGAYSINTRKGATLVFSFMGMTTQEIRVGESVLINVVLEEDAAFLEEAVSIGYGTQQRSLVTTAITKVGAKEFEHAPQQNAMAQLQGKVPGLSVQTTTGQPGASSDLFIRGGTTTGVSGDAPLIIVDGVVSQGMRSIADMNTADIESIEVLKDAASTAIYGAKAANGIIIVKTKSGQKGKARVNFQYTFGLDEQPKRLNLMNAREYVYWTRKSVWEDPTATEADKAKFLEGSFGMSTGNPRNSANTLEFLDNYLDNYGQDFVANLIDNEGWQTMTDPVTGRKLIFQDNDFQDATYQKALKHDYKVTFQGGNDKGTFYASLGHLNQDGIVRGTFYKNFNFHFNSTYKLSDALTAHAKANMSVSQTNSMSSSVNSLERAMMMPPTYRLYYEDGSPAEGEGMSSFRPRAYENAVKTKYTYHPIYRYGFQFGLNWKIVDGLSFRPTIYYSSSEGISSGFEALNATTGTAIRPASASHQYDGHVQADAVLEYEKTIKKHGVDVVAGATYSRENEFVLSGNGSGAASDLIPTLNATADSTQRTSSTLTNEAMLSYFGRINYNYDGRYLASVSLRADGSSRFAENHRWGYFPGASLGWNVHKEAFYGRLKNFMNKLKLRASWGQAGNNSLSLANSRGQYSVTGTTYLGKVGVLNTTLGNADLVWETTESLDAGVDLGFFNNRLELLVDVYDKKTFNRLYDNKLPTTTGYSSIKCNYGTLGTKGIEIELNAVPVSTRDFTWNMGFNFTFYRTIVLSQPDNGELKNRTGGNYIYDPVTGEDVKVGGFAEGERFGVRYAYHYLGVYQTDEEAAAAPYDENAAGRKKYAGDAIWEDKNKDDIINAKDMIFMGYIRPDKQGGFTNEFRWKNFSARIVTDFAMGHVINNGSKAYCMGSIRNNYNTYRDVITECWRSDNTSAPLPRFSPKSDADYKTRNFTRTGEGIGSSTSGQSNNSYFYQKGDYLAVREISFSYNLPATLTQKMRISSLQLFGGVYNVGYITGYDGMTPELYLGYDYGFYPRPREFSVGLNIGF